MNSFQLQISFDTLQNHAAYDTHIAKKVAFHATAKKLPVISKEIFTLLRKSKRFGKFIALGRA